MATSVYFSQNVKSEQFLYEDIVIESLKMYGQDVMYMPREMTRDRLLNEVIESRFTDAYSIEMYIEDVQGFGGDGALMSKFGLEMRDQATFIVARRSWENLIRLFNNNISHVRPMEGDLLYHPLTKSFFEIKFVEHEQPFYQLSNLTVYKLQCELFEYSNEVINTGDPDIDNLQRVDANSTIILVDSGINNGIEYIIGETITQEFSEFSITAELLNIEYINILQRKISVSNIQTSDGQYHEFLSGSRIVGTESEASWNAVTIYDISNQYVDNTFIDSGQAQNREFELLANDYVDFSENNPFGDPSQTFGLVSYSSNIPTALKRMDSSTHTVDSITTMDQL